jgi:predicted Zn-dependent protease
MSKSMKRIFAFTTASLLAFQMQAQSVDEGIKLYHYERYASAKQVLEPLAGTNPEANYYLGLSDIGLEDLAAAKAVFAKNPEDFYSQAGMARVLFGEGNKAGATKLLNDLADHAKKRDW